MTTTRLPLAARLLGAGLLVAGCGGGGDDPVAAAPANEVPVSASASTAAMVQFIAALDDADDREPLDVANFAPPTPDDAEPEPLS